MKTPPLIAAAPLAFLLLAACGGGRVWDRKVDGSDKDAYDAWYQRTTELLPEGDAPILKEAEQEIHLDIMGHSDLHGEDAINDAYLTQVNGKTVLQLIDLGLHDRLTRLGAFRDEAKRLIATNSQITGANQASTDKLNSIVEQQKDALDKTEADIASTQADLARIHQQAQQP